jgi:hypothetical protein
MDNYIKLVQERIKYLKELVTTTSIQNSFSVQARLTEAEFILKLLQDNKK